MTWDATVRTREEKDIEGVWDNLASLNDNTVSSNFKGKGARRGSDSYAYEVEKRKSPPLSPLSPLSPVYPSSPSSPIVFAPVGEPFNSRSGMRNREIGTPRPLQPWYRTTSAVAAGVGGAGGSGSPGVSPTSPQSGIASAGARAAAEAGAGWVVVASEEIDGVSVGGGSTLRTQILPNNPQLHRDFLLVNIPLRQEAQTLTHLNGRHRKTLRPMELRDGRVLV